MSGLRTAPLLDTLWLISKHATSSNQMTENPRLRCSRPPPADKRSLSDASPSPDHPPMTITKDPSAPLVVVVGSTGTQGGSVIKELGQSDKPYRIRGLTRDTNKKVAQELAEKGVELFSVSLTAENREQTYKAFEGATYAFAVTNYWEHLKKRQGNRRWQGPRRRRQTRQGQTAHLVRACRLRWDLGRQVPRRPLRQ